MDTQTISRTLTENQEISLVARSENDKSPGDREFKKSAEIGHGSSAPLGLHPNTVKQVFGELSHP